MPEIRFVVSGNIKKIRKRCKVTQEELAEKTGIDYKYIQRLEGKNPPNVQIDTLERIAKSLKTTPSNLLNLK